MAIIAAIPSMSDEGRALLKRLEGLKLTAYRDGGGWSIGYGHHGAKEGQHITQSEAERLFDSDLERFELAVAESVPLEVTSQAQFDAMVSLAYNVGAAAFRGSTLVNHHAAGDYQAAAAEFAKWNKSEGKVLPALVARRKTEAALYLRGLSEFPPRLGNTSPGEVIPARAGNAAVPLVAGVALVFFCPACGAASRTGCVRVEREGELPPMMGGVALGRQDG